jgi:hypothetical protein
MIESLVADLNEEGWCLYHLEQYEMYDKLIWACTVRKIGGGTQPIGRGRGPSALLAISDAIANRGELEEPPKGYAEARPTIDFGAILSGLGVEKQSFRRR